MNKPNSLIDERSPYLRQHAKNPVSWFPWSAATLALAESQGKLIFLSIGYSTCYWCHVMEQDSFENLEIAKVLNDNFISIKVDREERPDVDNLYMHFVQSLRGQGGWPLSVFLTPQGKPLWGGTFFPRQQFAELLNHLAKEWQNRRDDLMASGEELSAALADTFTQDPQEEPQATLVNNAIEEFKQDFDPTFGGFGSAPKFPPSQQLSFLMRCHRRDVGKGCIDLVIKTLAQMACGGIFDQLGGGFHRYSTDERWLVPHFEKMLYDNALLAQCYLHAFQITKVSFLGSVARQTLDFVEKELRAPTEGFYSALDAGEVGKEGEYYLWSYGEISASLSQAELKALSDNFYVCPEGNFDEGKIILSYRENKAWSDRQSAELLGALEKLRDIRGRRDSPSLDTKIITAWNGIMISAMALAHRVCAEQRYYDRAQAAAKFIRDRLFYDQQLMRSYCEGEVKHPACLEDYVFFIDGLLSLYQSDFDPDWLRLALNLQQIQDRKLWDVQDNLYFFAQENELFARKKEVFDGAIPSANNQAVLNLLRLDFFFPNNGFATRARAILRRLSHLMGRYPRAFPTALCSLDASLSGIDSLVIAYGSQKRAALDIIREVRMAYCPDLLVCVHTEELSALKEKMGLNNKNTYYLCAGNVCYPATTKPDEIKVLLEGVVK